MRDKRRKKLWAEELLQEKQGELGRLPKKDDFDEATLLRYIENTDVHKKECS